MVAGVPDPNDVESFLEEVGEVSRLIDGLQAGTISVDYIDGKLANKPPKESRSAGESQNTKTSTPKQSAVQCTTTESKLKDDEIDDQEEERKQRIQAKVQELKANYERKQKARERYCQYVDSKDTTRFGTDYTKWGMWCPEDEEDDLINSCTPNSAEFRALEKDFNDRHKRMVEQRQMAERQRVAGNEAFKQGQYSEALRCYQLGIESQKTNMALHANAAMAAIKINCYVQAIEHCDKAMSIADFLHNNTKDPLCTKALQRRATAYRALQQYDKAVTDLKSALAIEPANKELQQQLAKAQRDLEEYRKQKQIRKALAKGEAAAGAAGVMDLDKLRQVEQHIAALQASSTPAAAPLSQQSHSTVESPGSAVGEAAAVGTDQAAQQPKAGSHGPRLPPPKPRQHKSAEGHKPKQSAVNPAVCPQHAACLKLKQLLADDDSCCVYFRECGGMQAAAKLASGNQPSTAQPAQLRAAALVVLDAACMNDGNLLLLPSLGLPRACVTALDSKDGAECSAAVRLLCTAITYDDVRKDVSKHLGTEKSMATIVELMNSADAVVQGLTVAILGNCMVDAPCKEAMRKVLSQQSLISDCLHKLIKGANAVIAEKTLTLLGNMCGDAGIRQALQGHSALISAVAEVVVGSSKSQERGSLCLPAITALYNLVLDAPAQEAVASSGQMEGLVGLIQHRDARVMCRAAGALSRIVKQQRGVQAVRELGGMQKMLQLTTQILDGSHPCMLDGTTTDNSNAGSSSSSSSSSSSNTTAVSSSGPPSTPCSDVVTTVDAAIRSLALMTAGSQAQEGVPGLLSHQGLELLLRVLSAPWVTEGILGNAALCISHVASQPQNLALLRKKDAVAALLKVAYAGKGNTASKNAAIALAKMAQDAAMLERLRELHGIEIIYQYVRP